MAQPGLGSWRVERQYACDEDLSVTGHRAPRLEENPGTRPGGRSVVGFHLLDDTLYILANADGGVGYGRRNGRLECHGKPSIELGYPGHGRRRQASPEIKNGQFHAQLVSHPIGKCQHLTDVSKHLLRAAQHAAHMAVDCGELQYATLVHLLDGSKRFPLTDGQPELPAPS